jgi:hypothetical protein
VVECDLLGDRAAHRHADEVGALDANASRTPNASSTRSPKVSAQSWTSLALRISSLRSWHTSRLTPNRRSNQSDP